MRIAVTYENGQIFQHFGHTREFKVYDISDGKIISSQILDSSASGGHGALAGFLQQQDVRLLICGGIGAGAQTALAEAGIAVMGGVSGNADEQVGHYLAGDLIYDPNVRCSHHDGAHAEGGAHACGHHH